MPSLKLALVAIALAVSPSAWQDRSSMKGATAAEILTLHGAGLYFIVTDSKGRRVGRLGADSTAFAEIPGGGFDDDVSPDNHLDTKGATARPIRVFEVTLPVETNQSLSIVAVADTTLGADKAWLFASRELGKGVAAERTFPLAIRKGERYTWRLTYDARVTAPVSLEPLDSVSTRAMRSKAFPATGPR